MTGLPVLCTILKEDNGDKHMLRGALECLNIAIAPSPVRLPSLLPSSEPSSKELLRKPFLWSLPYFSRHLSSLSCIIQTNAKSALLTVSSGNRLWLEVSKSGDISGVDKLTSPWLHSTSNLIMGIVAPVSL